MADDKQDWGEIAHNLEDYFRKFSKVDGSTEKTVPAFIELLERLWQLDHDPENPVVDEKGEFWFRSFQNINASWNIQFSQPKVSGSPEQEQWWKLLEKLDEHHNQPLRRFEINKPLIGKHRFSWLVQTIRRIFHRLILPYTQTISDYVNTIITLQHEFNQTVVALQHEIIVRLLIERQVVFNAEMVRLLNQILQNILFSRQKRFNMLVKELLKHIPQTLDQNYCILDRKLAAVMEQHAELKALRIHLNAMLHQSVRVTKDPGESIRSNVKDESEKSQASDSGSRDTFLDDFYLQFENAFRGSSQKISELQQKYLYYFSQDTGIVLDIGCGRGEFLDLLKEKDIPARGIDSNPMMIQVCRERNLDVQKSDAFSYLQQMEDNSLGGIFSAHFIEHFPHEYVIDFFRLAFRKLVPGAWLVVETPNPRSVLVGASLFYRDPTHCQPYHPDTLEFLLDKAGYSPVIVQESAFLDEQQGLRALPDMSPIAKIDPVFYQNIKHNFIWLSHYLCAAQDFAVIAQKPATDHADET